MSELTITYPTSSIVSVTLTEEGTLEVVRRYPSNTIMLSDPPQPSPDRIVKEIYRAGKEHIYLSATIEGKHTPGYYVPEKVEF